MCGWVYLDRTGFSERFSVSDIAARRVALYGNTRSHTKQQASFRKNHFGPPIESSKNRLAPSVITKERALRLDFHILPHTRISSL